MKHEPKISLPEIIIITPYLLIIDIIGIALVSVGLDDFGMLDVIRFPITQLYLRIKGVKSRIDLIGNIVKLFPYIGAFPFVIFWVITIYMDRNPSIANLADKAVKADVRKIDNSPKFTLKNQTEE